MLRNFSHGVKNGVNGFVNSRAENTIARLRERVNKASGEIHKVSSHMNKDSFKVERVGHYLSWQVENFLDSYFEVRYTYTLSNVEKIEKRKENFGIGRTAKRTNHTEQKEG